MMINIIMTILLIVALVATTLIFATLFFITIFAFMGACYILLDDERVTKMRDRLVARGTADRLNMLAERKPHLFASLN